MDESVLGKTGIYIVCLKSAILKSIYRPKNYKTKVNNQHIKVGIAKKDFKSRKSGYEGNFDNEVIFTPFVLIEREMLDEAERKIIAAIINNNIRRVGRSREWFHTSNFNEISKIITDTLSNSDIEHQYVAIQTS